MRGNAEGTVCRMVRCAVLALPVVAAVGPAAIADDVRAHGAAAVLVETPSLAWSDGEPLREMTASALREQGLVVYSGRQSSWDRRLGPQGEREMASAGVDRLFILRVELIGMRPRAVLEERRLGNHALLARVASAPLYLEQMPEVIPALVQSLVEGRAVDRSVTVVSPSEDTPVRALKIADRVISAGTFGWGFGGSVGYETRNVRLAAAISIGSNDNSCLVAGVTGFLNGRAPISPFVEAYVGYVGIEGATGWGALVNGGVALYRNRRAQILAGAGLAASVDAQRVYPTARVEISFR